MITMFVYTSVTTRVIQELVMVMMKRYCLQKLIMMMIDDYNVCLYCDGNDKKIVLTKIDNDDDK